MTTRQPASRPETTRRHGQHADMAAVLTRWHEEHGAQKFAIAPVGLEDEQMAALLLGTARELGARHRIILLDAQGADSDLSRRHPGKGLADFLRGQAGFAEVVHPDEEARHLHIVPAGTHAPMPEDLHTPLMRQLLEALEENYDIILLWEGMPRFPLREKGSVLPLADGVAVVHVAGMEGAAESLRASLAEAGVRLAAVLMAERRGAKTTDMSDHREAMAGA